MSASWLLALRGWVKTALRPVTFYLILIYWLNTAVWVEVTAVKQLSVLLGERVRICDCLVSRKLLDTLGLITAERQ